MQPNKVWLLSDLIEKNKRVFRVPVYQRNYDWSNVQCEKLYYDIINAFERDHKHFTGTIVYIVGLYSSNLSEVLIIDGQQRLTTVYILLKALYDASLGVSTRIEEEIEEVMFNRKCEEIFKVKLKPIKSDNMQLTLLIENKLDDMDRNSNIYKNYITFKNLIKESLDSGLELNDILEGIKKLEVVEIVLDKSQGDEPQKIFESINSTGLELSLADLIRNYLLMDDSEQEYLYNTYWMAIEKNVGYRNLEDYFVNYLNSKNSKVVNSRNAYQLFKEYCKENELSHECVLKNLERTSKYYGAFIGVNSYYSKNITRYLDAFNTIKQTTVLPLLFRIFDDYEDNNIDEDTLCKVLSYLLTYYVRKTACEVNKNLSKFMKSLYDRVITDGYDNYYEKFVIFLNDLRANDRMPSDKEFKDALIYKPLYKKPICKYVLSVIENSTKEHIDISNLTIEHILPQKENAAVWRKEVGEDYSHVYEVYLHTLGNLTITGYNSELGTKSFAEKKDIIMNNSKAVILNEDVLSADTWNEEMILKRANALSDILMNAFEYVNLHSDILETDYLGFDVNSGVDFSGTQPESFELLGETKEVNNWTDLLTKFMGIAYELDADLFNNLAANNYSIPSASRVYISNDKREMRECREIGKSGIYFEKNLSANNIISFIRDLLQQMNLDVDDFSFSLAEGPFDINNESTWSEGKIAVAKLFYNLIENLIIENRISTEEIELLKEKVTTKKLFNASDYPALANKVTDNMGNSSQKRYRAKPLLFEGKDLYVSTQFFDVDRDAIIEWYKSH